MSKEGFKAASADPSDQTSGGFLDGQSGTIYSAKAVKWDYAGKGPSVPALMLKIHLDGTNTLREQALSAGTLAKVRPSKDGKQFLTANGKGISSQCKTGMFYASLASAGWPKKKWADVSEDVATLEGLHVTFAEIPMPRMRGDDDSETKRQPTALTVAEIDKLPWENKGFRKAIDAELEESADEDESEDEDEDDDADEDSDDDSDESEDEDEDDEKEKDDDEDSDDEDSDEEDEDDSVNLAVAKETLGAIQALLKSKKHSKGISVDDLAPAVFQQVKASKQKRKVVELAQDEKWLAKNFTVKKGKVTPKE